MIRELYEGWLSTNTSKNIFKLKNIIKVVKAIGTYKMNYFAVFSKLLQRMYKSNYV
jgi:hypothetical protein